MAEPQTVNCGLIVANTGDLVGTWGSAALNPDFVALDGYLGGVQTVSVSNAPITLTSPAGFSPTPGGGPTQAQNAVLIVTGSMTGNVVVTLPLPGIIIIHNLTSGNPGFVLQFRAVGTGEVICVGAGNINRIYNDGTNVRFADLPAIGSYLDVAATSVPQWIQSCTKNPYLICDGSTFNATTYSQLNQFLGGNTLPDFRGRGSFYLNGGTGRVTSAGAGIDGNTLFAAGGNNGIALAANQIPTITSSGSMNSPSPNVVTSNQNTTPFSTNAGGANQWLAWALGSIQAIGTLTSSGTVTSTNTGNTNIQNASPGVVSGLRLIRAG
jgi:Phage Tail Collar Domain